MPAGEQRVNDGRDLDKILGQVTNEAREALGDNLVSFLLYGSQVRGDATPNSDINLFLIVRDCSVPHLAPLQKLVPEWSRHRVTAPVVFEYDQISRSLDTFALEFLEMAASHRMLAGEDPFVNFAPDWEAVRRELEEEAREKTILLQRRWFATGGRDKLMRATVIETVPGYLALLRGTLHVQRQSAKPILTDAIFAGEVHYPNFDPQAWQKLWETSKGLHFPTTSQLTQLLKDYLEQARILVKHIDGLLHQ